MDELAKFQQQFIQHSAGQHYKKTVYRFVETQEYAATTNLVDDLDEQFLLEQMLDEVKPPYRSGTEDMHYLLKTPFRYPPLQYGSRFGNHLMASFFYAGETVDTTLSEVAYYRFVFLSHMSEPYHQAIQSEHLLFSVNVSSLHCADLTHKNLQGFKSLLRGPSSYVFSQHAGKWLVEDQESEVIRYFSARHESGINVAIFEPCAIVSRQPEEQQRWLCLTRPDKISFSQHGQNQKPVAYERERFLVDGRLPQPA